MYKSNYNLKFENSSSEFVSYVGPRLNLAGSLNIVFGVVSFSIASSSPDLNKTGNSNFNLGAIHIVRTHVRRPLTPPPPPACVSKVWMDH